MSANSRCRRKHRSESMREQQAPPGARCASTEPGILPSGNATAGRCREGSALFDALASLSNSGLLHLLHLLHTPRCVLDCRTLYRWDVAMQVARIRRCRSRGIANRSSVRPINCRRDHALRMLAGSTKCLRRYDIVCGSRYVTSHRDSAAKEWASAHPVTRFLNKVNYLLTAT